MLGLGSMLGTGVFVTLGLAAGIVGDAIWVAVLVGGALAGLSGLSAARLAAAHPVSGGTYEYGYREINAGIGVLSGWLFPTAKSASAGTAAIGLVRAAGLAGRLAAVNLLKLGATAVRWLRNLTGSAMVTALAIGPGGNVNKLRQSGPAGTEKS